MAVSFIDYGDQMLTQIMEQMKQGFENVNQRFDGIDARLDNVEYELSSLKETVENNATEFRSHFKHIESKLDKNEKMFEIFSEELRGTNIDIKFLCEKSGVHEKEINQLKTRFHL